MNVPATLSATNTVAALLAALLTARISRGPGWRELRYFSWASLLAALFSILNLPLTLDVSDGVKLWGGRLNFAVAALHGGAWILYYVASEHRRATWYERFSLGTALAGAALTLVPGTVQEPVLFDRHLAWLGVTYRDVVVTRFGGALIVFYCAVMVALLAGYVRRWRRGEATARSHAIAMSVLVICSINDAFASSNLTTMPYVLDLGFTFVVVAVGSAVTARFVENARALDESTMQLAETQRELVGRERLAAIGELSAVVAHEVRNPLAVIFNAVAGLNKLHLGDEPRVLLEIVEEEAGRLKRLVAELLEFARPRDAALEPVELEPLLHNAIDTALQSTQKHELVEIVVSSVIATVRCDAELLRQAIINLVSNALLSQRRRGPVRVVAELEGIRTIRIAVVDDGEGIPEAILERIFMPFFTTRPTGTGLGLPIVRRVAEAHGGTVTHEHSPGGGATFVLRLPFRGESVTRRAADVLSEHSIRLQ